MPSNKDRLYVGLYARGGGPTMPDKEDKYHWALLVGPKDEAENGTGMRYDAKDRVTGPNTTAWFFEEKETSLAATSMLLVRVMIAKIEQKDRFVSIVRNTPTKQGVAGWTCIAWVQEALQNLEADGEVLGTGMTEWTTVKKTAMEYCKRKEEEHRFDGQGSYDMTKVPTYDLVEGKETIP